MKPRVVIVEDDESLAWIVTEQVRQACPELDVYCFTDPTRALAHVRQEPPQLLITDLRMPGLSGVDLVRKARSTVTALPVIVMTGDCTADERRTLLRHGVSDWLNKPFEMEELLAAVAHALAPEPPPQDWPAMLAEGEFTLCGAEFAPAPAPKVSQTLGSLPSEGTIHFAPAAFNFSPTPPAVVPTSVQVKQPSAPVGEQPDWQVVIVPLQEDAPAADTAPPPSLPAAPPLPGGQPGREILSPPWMAGLLLSDVLNETPRLRADLLPPGTTDKWLYQAGRYCLKTSQEHCFADLATASAYLSEYLADHAALGELHPDDTFHVLTPDDREQYWLWTIAPWLLTLERELDEAAELDDEVALAAALCKFAEAAECSLRLALSQRVLLNVQPASFASVYAGGPLVYVGNRIERGYCLPDIGQALLSPAEVFAAWPQAVDVYLNVLGVGISHRFTREQVRQLDLLRALREVTLTDPALQLAQTQLIERIRQCPE